MVDEKFHSKLKENIFIEKKNISKLKKNIFIDKNKNVDPWKNLRVI